jgi:hypothetical protein
MQQAPIPSDDRHWLNQERLRLYSCAFLVVYLSVWVYFVCTYDHGVDRNGVPLGSDFIAFWSASHLALSGQALSAYDPQQMLAAERGAVPWADFKAFLSWQYPPTFYLAVLPLALLPYFYSLLLFLGATLAAFLAAMRRVLPQPQAWLPLLAFPGVFINAGCGQNGFLTAALITAALSLLETRSAWAGLLIALLTIKPQLGLLLPLALLCGRQWRALGYATLGTILFGALSVQVLGVATLQQFQARLPVVAQWLAEGNLPLKKMPTFFAMARLFGAPLGLACAVHGAVALFAAGAVAWVWLRCADAALRAAALVVGTLLVTPYLYDYDLVWLAPALGWFVTYALRTGWRPLEREVLVAAWLLPGVVLILHHILQAQLAALVVLTFFLVILRRAVDEVRAAAPAGAA